MAKIPRMTNLTPQAHAILRDHQDWNVSAMLEEAIWARHEAQRPKTKEDEEAAVVAKAAEEARKAYQTNQADQVAKEAAERASRERLVATYKSEVARLYDEWQTTAKEFGITSVDAKEAALSVARCRKEAMEAGIDLTNYPQGEQK